MLRVTLDVNGKKIGCIGIWNTQEQRLTEDDALIRYQIHDLGDYDGGGGDIAEYPLIGEVWHSRSDGAVALVELVMGEIDSEDIQ